MNTAIRTETLPLPLPRQHPGARRQQIAGICLSENAIAEYNAILHALHEQAPQVDADQVISLARWLQVQPAETAAATLHERMARVESLRCMLNDADWEFSSAFAQRARQLLDYVCRFDDLIPDELPLVGHLDDALLVELSWPALAGEVRDYSDFRRFNLETKPRGTPNERRLTWESICLAEANRLRQQRDIRQRGYARPQPLTSLRVC